MQVTKEQLAIIHSENNQIVNANPGAGKTTTALQYAKLYPHKKILLLGFGAELKEENRKKINKNKLQNIEAQNIHSFCLKYYHQNSCRDDKTLKLILENDTKPLKIFDYHVIVMDECQDLDYLKFRILKKIIQDNRKGKDVKIVLLGDKSQAIFGFLGADRRYLTKGDILLSDISNRPFEANNLSKSFRLSKEIADAVNFVIGEERIFSDKVTGIKPKYHILDVYRDIPYILNRIINLYDSGCDNIYILAPSVRNRTSPIRMLENSLKRTRPDINVFVIDRNVQKDKEVMKDKIVFSTPLPTKGTEREAVILYNFDEDLFKMYYRSENKNVLPDTYYVAMSRAITHLEVIHSNKSNYFSFLDVQNLDQYFDVHCVSPFTFSIYPELKTVKIAVTDLIAYLTLDVIEGLLSDFEIKEIQMKKNPIKLKSKCYNITNDNVEPVSDFNGIAIPTFFEIKRTNESTILKELQDDNPEYEIKNAFEMLEIPILLKVVMDYNSLCNGYIGRQMQIDSTNWLTQENLEDCRKRLNNLDIEDTNLTFEKNVIRHVTCKNKEFNLIGTIDLMNDSSVYEFKAKKEIDDVDFLQLLLYAFLMEENPDSDRKLQTHFKKYYLFNVVTDQLFEICFTFDKLEKLVFNLLHEKYFTVKNELSDAEFLKKNLYMNINKRLVS